MTEESTTPISNNSRWTSRWRPYLALIFGLILICDFILFPIGWTLVQTLTGVAVTQWIPLTLSQGGLFYVAMASFLGVAAWTRGVEKIETIRKQ